MFISPAYASNENVHHSGNLFQDPTFWVALAFLLTVLLLVVTAKKAIIEALNNRSKSIADKLSETKKISDDAEKLMLNLKDKKENFEITMKSELEKVVEQANKTKQKNEEILFNTMKNKKTCLENQLSNSLDTAIEGLTSEAVDVSIKASYSLIKEKLKAHDHQSLIRDAVDSLRV